MEVVTNSKQETQKIGQEFAKGLKGGDVVCLYGDLGAGKTVFASAVAKALGVEKNITSPTFIFEKSYKIGSLTLHHIDLYRAESIEDLKALALDEIFSQDTIVMIEWAQSIEEYLPEKRIDVTIKKEDENKRRITIDRR